MKGSSSNQQLFSSYKKRSSDSQLLQNSAGQHTIQLSLAQLITTVIGSILVSFSIGQVLHHHGIQNRCNKVFELSPVGNEKDLLLDPTHPDVLTIMNIDPSRHDEYQQEACSSLDTTCTPPISEGDTELDHDDEVAFQNQQLLVDIKNIDKELLGSMVELDEILIQTSDLVGQPLLSHTCHRTKPTGLTCVGFFHQGHVTLHTWSHEGAALLDIFIPGSYSLLEIIPMIRKLFERQDTEKLQLTWILKLRGLHDFIDGDINPEEADIGRLLGNNEYSKDVIASATTDFQRINIFDLRHSEGVAFFNKNHAGSSTDEIQKKDRIIFLDGVMQSRTMGEAAYHESLVHPAMFTHQYPTRVAIIGGGEGATLREVLKHDTVEKVVMIEIDELMVNVSRSYLPEWSDCSSLNGGYESCFDDSRSELHYTDSVKWFIDRFGSKANYTIDDGFDVIIMDALDPNSEVEFSDVLYDNEEFSIALSNALGDQGILVAQLGQTDCIDDPPSSYEGSLQDAFIESLINKGMQSIAIYEEIHGRFMAPWKYMVAMKDKKSRSRWMMTDAELQRDIYNRLKGDSHLKFFDGGTMKTYEFPSRVLESKWCMDHLDVCSQGHGYDPTILDAPRSLFDVKISNVTNGGRGVFSNDFIRSGSYIGLSECVHSIFVPPKTYAVLEASAIYFNDIDYFECFESGYIEGYGWLDNEFGDFSAGVDSGIFTFVNHGCNGTYNLGTKLNAVETTSNVRNEMTRFYKSEYDNPFDVFNQRHFPKVCDESIALQDIESGEELLDNYLVHGGMDSWEEMLSETQMLCSGGSGVVSRYEQCEAESCQQ